MTLLLLTVLSPFTFFWLFVCLSGRKKFRPAVNELMGGTVQGWEGGREVAKRATKNCKNLFLSFFGLRLVHVYEN
jgi:hypothetical protein